MLAKTVIDPTVYAAISANQVKGKLFGDVELAELVAELRDQVGAVNKGDLHRGEAMLTAQAHTLDATFNRFVMTAVTAESVKQIETLMKLALRAQSQCRATWEAISHIQNPTVNYVKQANIAQNQQVNNGVAESIPEKRISPNELLEQEHERLDARTPQAPIRTDQELEPMAAVHRAKN